MAKAGPKTRRAREDLVRQGVQSREQERLHQPKEVSVVANDVGGARRHRVGPHPNGRGRACDVQRRRRARERDPARAFPDRAQARRWRHGRGLSRHRSRARSPGRDQGPARRHALRGRARSAGPRGARTGTHPPPQRRAHLLHWRGRRSAVLRDGVSRRQDARRAARGGAAVDRRRARGDPRRRARAARGASLGVHAPRRQTVEPHDRRPRRREGPRLRARRRERRPRRRRPGRTDQPRRHAALHGARASARRADRSARRHVRARRHAVSLDLGQAAVRRRDRRRAHHVARVGRAPDPTARREQARRRHGDRRADRADDGAGRGRSVRELRRPVARDRPGVEPARAARGTLGARVRHRARRDRVERRCSGWSRS